MGDDEVVENTQGRIAFGQDIRRCVELEYAGALQRLFACIFDCAIAYAIFLFFAGQPKLETTTTEFLGEQLSRTELVYDLPSWYLYLIFFLIKVIFEVSPLQASPGKLLFFLKVTDNEGEKLNILGVILREVFYFFPFSFITYFFSDEKQCIHDKVASSVVIKKNELSNILFFPALILSVISLILVGMWAQSKTVPDMPEQIQQIPQEVREKSLEDAIIPEDDKIGSIKIDGEETAINSALVRLKDTVKYTSFGELKKSAQELEIALYEDQINSEKLKRLNGVSDLMNNSKAIVKNNPVAFISIKSDTLDSNCKNQIIKESDLIINSSLFGDASKENHRLKLRLDDMKLNSLVIMLCEAVKADEELFFSMQAPLKDENGRNIIMNIRFTEKVRELKYVGGYVYRHSNPKRVLAVYNKEQKLMKIAFYKEQFSKASLNTAYAKGILPTSPKPEFLIEVPFDEELYGSGRDIINNGYTITFTDLPSTIAKGTGDYQIKFGAGEVPARFVVQSPHAPQVQGRLEGLKEIANPKGLSYLAWNVSFNARIVLIKR